MITYITIAQCAWILGKSKSTIRRWYDEGRFEGTHTPGKHRRIKVTSIRPHLDSDEKRNRGLRIILQGKDKP